MDVQADFDCEWPQPGQTVSGYFRALPGGKGLNQAMSVARLGVKTHIVGLCAPAHPSHPPGTTTGAPVLVATTSPSPHPRPGVFKPPPSARAPCS
eukprot:4868284-Prymnesium_polylepis.1